MIFQVHVLVYHLSFFLLEFGILEVPTVPRILMLKVRNLAHRQARLGLMTFLLLTKKHRSIDFGEGLIFSFLVELTLFC